MLARSSISISDGVPPTPRRHLKEAPKKANAEKPAPITFFGYTRPFAPFGAFGRTGAFAEVLNAAKLDGKGYTFHSWRHTFRTRLSEAGVSDDLARAVSLILWPLVRRLRPSRNGSAEPRPPANRRF